MSKLWTIPSLFVITGVFAAACAPSGEVSDSKDGEESIVTQLPLSEGCSACAGDVIGAQCGDALDACAGNEDCLDVSGCFEGCEPDDAACFASCAAASALFEELVGCVVCDACADSCEGEWTCGGNDDGGDGEDGEDGEDGGNDDGGDDDKDGEDGGNDDGGDDDKDGEDGGNDDGGNDDGGDDGKDGEDGGGGSESACLECVKGSTEGECAEIVGACMENEGCRWVAECIQGCGADVECASHCLQEGENADFVAPLLECALCNTCADVCPVDPYCG